MGVLAKGIPRGCQGLFTPVSLGYPLSVFNKNSTLKKRGNVSPRLRNEFILVTTLSPFKIGDSPIQSNMKLGQQTNIGAESQS